MSPRRTASRFAKKNTVLSANQEQSILETVSKVVENAASGTEASLSFRRITPRLNKMDALSCVQTVMDIKDEPECESVNIAEETGIEDMADKEDNDKTQASSPLFHQKTQRGKPLKRGEKVLIMNVYGALRMKHKDYSERTLARVTSELTGCSTSGVFRLKTEFQKNGGPLPTAGKHRPKAIGKRARVCVYDEFTLSAIRKKVHEFFFCNEIPTSEQLCNAVNADEMLPNFQPRTMRNLMLDLGFQHAKRKSKNVLLERDDIVLWRRRYLRQIRQYRLEGRAVYFLDETWVNVDAPASKVNEVSSPVSTTTGLKPPPGKGGRLVLLHAGNENGFVHGAEFMFHSKKTADCLEEIDSLRFEQWLNNYVLPNIKPNSVIVIDNAPYHMEKVDCIPTNAMPKTDIQVWLASKGVLWLPDMIKRELLVLVNNIKDRYEEYRIDRHAESRGHKILRLPPFHCELSPINMIWAEVRGYVAQRNSTFQVAAVEALTRQALAQITEEVWSKYVSRALKEEDFMWDLDSQDDIQVDRLAFVVNDFSSDDSDD